MPEALKLTESVQCGQARELMKKGLWLSAVQSHPLSRMHAGWSYDPGLRRSWTQESTAQVLLVLVSEERKLGLTGVTSRFSAAEA